MCPCSMKYGKLLYRFREKLDDNRKNYREAIDALVGPSMAAFEYDRSSILDPSRLS